MSGSNLRLPTETESERRERMAEEKELYARLFAKSPHANLRALAPTFKARAASLRAGKKETQP